MDNIVERFEHNGRTVTIYQDEDCESPRESDNLATIACWHRSASLGDVQVSPKDGDSLDNEQAFVRWVERDGDEVLAILPVWIYQHSGMTVRASRERPGYPFNCQWDSGQVGWAYVARSQAKRMGCVGSYKDREYFEDVIVQEVANYDDYLTGRCYGYTVTGIDGDEVDSCWGFVGDFDYVREQAKESAYACEDPGVEREAAELSERATFASGGAS